MSITNTIQAIFTLMTVTNATIEHPKVRRGDVEPLGSGPYSRDWWYLMIEDPRSTNRVRRFRVLQFEVVTLPSLGFVITRETKELTNWTIPEVKTSEWVESTGK
jgi:hypothetical protein